MNFIRSINQKTGAAACQKLSLHAAPRSCQPVRRRRITDTTANWFLVSAIGYFFIVGIIALTIAAKFCWPELLGTVPVPLLWPAAAAACQRHALRLAAGRRHGARRYYIVPRLCGVKLWSEKLGVATAVLWNVIILGAVFALLGGYNQGLEYAELPLPLDILVVVAWIMFGVNIFATIATPQIPADVRLASGTSWAPSCGPRSSTSPATSPPSSPPASTRPT